MGHEIHCVGDVVKGTKAYLCMGSVKLYRGRGERWWVMKTCLLIR